MPIYVYQTIPDSPGDVVRRYEIWQSMKEDPLEKHPETVLGRFFTPSAG